MMNYHIIESLQQIEDEWGLDISETSEDRIKFLKREFKFLDLFLSLQSFTDLSYMANVTHKVQHLFRHAAVDLRLINEIDHVDRVTDQLQVKIQMTKLEIRSVYLFPKVNKDGIFVVTPKFVMDLIDTVVVNLGDLLKVYCSSSLLFVPEPKKEIGVVFKELKLLRNFVCFVSDRSIELKIQHTDFFSHVLVVVGHAAMIAWLYLPSNGSGENREMNVLLSDLLQTKIKPIDPSIQKVYIDVLQALRSEWHPIIQIDHVADCVAGFVETLQHNLKMLPVSNHDTHQIAALQEMLNLLIANLSIQDLEFHLQDIDSVMIDSGLLVYSLCEDVVLEEVIIDLPGTIQRIKTVIYHIIRKEFQSSLPRIHGLGYVDIVLSNLKEFQDRYPDSLAFVKTELQMIQTELEGVQPFLWSIAEEQYNIHGELQNYVALLIGKAYEVEYIVDACVSKKVPEWCLVFWLFDIITDIRAEVANIQQKKMVEVDLVSPYTIVTDTSRKSSEMAKMSGINEKIVGFEDVIETFRDLLAHGSRELDSISIVGMSGGGKTTLAKRLYFDKLVVSHFDIRAQCHVSPVYSLRGLLLSLLAMLHIDETSLHSNETDELKDIIYRSLRSRRYLILLDDVWDCRVWDDIRLCFPDDNNGSRILLTTRNHDVANNVISVSEPLHLRLLTYEESWVLLKVKVFGNETCYPHFENVGQEIARKCEGLPLSIVLVAGVLSKMEKTEDCWSQVAKDLGSYIAVDAKAILEPSYQHLPYHLKSCFLYFGTFLEAKEINVSKLTWLWIGEGFVKDLEGKSLQDIAKGYLENLHRRSLVMNAKRNSDGIVKACRIHDLLLDFCRRKAEEEHLLLWIKRDGNDKSSSGVSSHKQLAQRRLVFYCEEENLVERSSSCSPVDSVLYREDKRIDVSGLQDSRMFYNFKFLKVLDLESIVIYSFPTVLVYLRYFAAQTAQDSITSLITNLWNLETLILKPTKGKLKLPVTIWKMVKLRHLCIDNAYFTLNGAEGLVEKLEVLSSPCFSCAKDVELLSRKTPNLRELRCSFVDFRNDFFPKLDFLTQLETLEIHLAADSTVVGPYNFPESLRNLTLSNFFLGNCHKSNISELPNLRVLKLVSIYFDNDKWEVRDDKFLKLAVLKLVKCDFFEEWDVSDDAFAFPMLEHLVLRECLYLKAIPSSFQDISTLVSITVKSCSESVERSATYIKQQQEEYGNDYLKVKIQREKRDRLSGFEIARKITIMEKRKDNEGKREKEEKKKLSISKSNFHQTNKMKVVIRLSSTSSGNGQKNRTKALKIVVSQPGVESAAITGDEKNELEVVGDIDSAKLMRLLRKKLGQVELLSLGLAGGEDNNLAHSDSFASEYASFTTTTTTGSSKSLSFSRQERYLASRSAMELFHNAKAVRLHSHHEKYLTAEEDKESVTQDRDGASKNAKWTVEFIEKNENVIRLKSCYGKYLTASNQPFLLGMTGRKVVQTVPNPLDSSIEWKPIREGHKVNLRTKDGRFLKGNVGLPPWKHSVTHDILHRTTRDWFLWDVEILAHSDSFASEYASFTTTTTGSSKSLSFSRQESSDSLFSLPPKLGDGRPIYYHIMNEFGEIEKGLCITFKGNSVEDLKKRLEDETGLKDITVCTMIPLNGKLYPLRLLLPPNNARVDVIILPSSS